jgi:hypothetical protein
MGFDLHTINVLNGSSNSRQDRLLFGMLSGVATPASANAVTLLGSITPGTGFTNIGTISIAPTGGTGSGLTVAPLSLKAVSATVVGQGTSGFAVSDTITLSNGVVLTVATVSSGKVATVTVATAGSFTGQVATNPVSQVSTSGAGVGITTFNVSYGLATAAITNSGNYTAVPTGLTVTDTAGGTGASIAAPTLGGSGNPISVFVPFELPSGCVVQITPGMACSEYVPQNLKSINGFTAVFSPATTLAAGAFDAVIFA